MKFLSEEDGHPRQDRLAFVCLTGRQLFTEDFQIEIDGNVSLQ